MSRMAGLPWQMYRPLWSILRHQSWMNVRIAGTTLRQHLARQANRVLQHTVPNPMLVHGCTLYHDRSSLESLRMITGSYEPDTTALLERTLRPGQTFVDCGAHIGHFSLLAARKVVPSGRVYAFEPAMETFALLTRNIRVNHLGDIVRAIPRAVSDHPGPHTLFINHQDSMWHTLYGRGEVRQQTVETTTLDAFFAREGWPAVDVLKVDVEGAELAVLKGMTELNSRNPGMKLIIEFASDSFVATGLAPQTVFGQLQQMGFTQLSVVGQPQRAVQTFEDMLPFIRIGNTNDWYGNLFCAH
jgi:FkbM family methyltransferase